MTPMRRRNLHRITFTLAGSYNLCWGAFTIVAPQAIFDFAGMAQKAQEMLHKSLDALVNLDVKLAYEVIAADDDVDAINREMYGSIEQGIRKEPERVYSYIHLLGVSRHIERIADHASNIAEDVIYLVEGRIVRHHAEEFGRIKAQQ